MTEIVLGTLLLTLIVLSLALTVMLARSILSPSRPATLTVNGSTELETRTGIKAAGCAERQWHSGAVGLCRGGTCGLCKVKIVEGGAPPLPTETARLTKSDLRDGVHLACQVVLRGDLQVEVDNDLMAAEKFVCRVETVRALTPLIREIVLRQPEGMNVGIEAGSFVQVTAPAFECDYSRIDVPDAQGGLGDTCVRSRSPAPRT
jgi:Na+-transporting NADH:ubiquinone oxidoreductase subunit F